MTKSLIIALCTLSMFGCTNFTKVTCVKNGIVKEIGICDRFGRCGVKLESGEYGDVKYPMVGKNVCIKKEIGSV